MGSASARHLTPIQTVVAVQAQRAPPPPATGPAPPPPFVQAQRAAVPLENGLSDAVTLSSGEGALGQG